MKTMYWSWGSIVTATTKYSLNGLLPLRGIRCQPRKNLCGIDMIIFNKLTKNFCFLSLDTYSVFIGNYTYFQH